MGIFFVDAGEGVREMLSMLELSLLMFDATQVEVIGLRCPVLVSGVGVWVAHAGCFDCQRILGERRRVVGMVFVKRFTSVAVVFLGEYLFPLSLVFLLVGLCHC